MYYVYVHVFVHVIFFIPRWWKHRVIAGRYARNSITFKDDSLIWYLIRSIVLLTYWRGELNKPYRQVVYDFWYIAVWYNTISQHYGYYNGRIVLYIWTHGWGLWCVFCDSVGGDWLRYIQRIAFSHVDTLFYIQDCEHIISAAETQAPLADFRFITTVMEGVKAFQRIRSKCYHGNTRASWYISGTMAHSRGASLSLWVGWFSWLIEAWWCNIRHWTMSSLVQVQVCPLTTAKPLHEPIMKHSVDPQEQISVQFESNNIF